MARRPTVDEAVSVMAAAKTNKYRTQCIAFWKEKYGGGFSGDVERAFSGKQKKERK